MEVGPPKPAATATEASSSSCSSVAATAASLVAVGLGGAALLAWWALSFHPAHARLWMVPAGLVLLGTPVLAWLSLLASGPCRCGRRPVEAPAPGAHAGLSGTPLRSLQPATRSSSSSIDTYMPV